MYTCKHKVYINLSKFIANFLDGITTADATVFIVIKFSPECSLNTPFLSSINFKILSL